MSQEPEPRARRRAARRVLDSDQAAERLAQSTETTAVAELAPKQRHDQDFQSQPTRGREAGVGEEAGEVAEPRQTLEHAIQRQVRAGSLRAMMWLAGRAKLATPPNAGTPDQELRAILSALTTEELSEFMALRDEP
jgi:hypothetical protein